MLDGTVVYSCYYSPNASLIETFQADLEGSVRQSPGPIIVVAGDLNAKSRLWRGDPKDRRGHFSRNNGLTWPDSHQSVGDGNIRKKSVIIGTGSNLPSTNTKETPTRVDNIGKSHSVTIDISVSSLGEAEVPSVSFSKLSLRIVYRLDWNFERILKIYIQSALKFWN